MLIILRFGTLTAKVASAIDLRVTRGKCMLAVLDTLSGHRVGHWTFASPGWPKGRMCQRTVELGKCASASENSGFFATYKVVEKVRASYSRSLNNLPPGASTASSEPPPRPFTRRVGMRLGSAAVFRGQFVGLGASSFGINAQKR